MIRVLIIAFVLLGVVAVIAFPHRHSSGNLIKPVTTVDAWVWQQTAGVKGNVLLEGNTLRCTVDHISTLPRFAQLFQVGATIENGHTYRIKFAAKADKVRVIELNSSVNHMMYDNVGLKVPVPLSTEYQVFQYTFSGENADGLPDRVPTFVIGQETGSVWVKDVALEMVN